MKIKVVHTKDTESLDRCLSLSLHLLKPFEIYYFLKFVTWLKALSTVARLDGVVKLNLLIGLSLPFCCISHVMCHMTSLLPNVRARNLHFQGIGPLVWFFLEVEMSVCLFVCLFVHHTFSLRLTVFLPPLTKVQCHNFLDIWNPWEKVYKKVILDFKFFA